MIDIDDPEREQFSVYTFDADGFSTRERAFVSAERAVHQAQWLARSAAGPRRIARIIITDGGDHTVFEWRTGEGVTFPPRPSER